MRRGTGLNRVSLFRAQQQVLMVPGASTVAAGTDARLRIELLALAGFNLGIEAGQRLAVAAWWFWQRVV